MKMLVNIVRIFFQILGGVIFALGGMALVFEAIVLFAGDGRMNQVLGQVWFQHDPLLSTLGSPSIQLAQVVIERKLGLISLWNPTITTVLNWPSWIALLTIAAVLILVGGIVFSLATRLLKTSAE